MSTDDELTRRERPIVADEETRTVDPDGDGAPNGFPITGWARYQFVGCIGKGGMGAVYKAHDPQLKRYVALKFLMRTEGGRAKRFVAEARAQAKVEHSNVCKVYEVGTAQGVPYIAMQFIDGVTPSAAQEQMTIEDKVHVLRKVADAVHAAHQGGLIHRDLKRSNVMVERTERGNWQPFVLDFGLAREVDAGATIAGEVAGTPAYMAPEQARGERADRRTDVWGLGAARCGCRRDGGGPAAVSRRRADRCAAAQPRVSREQAAAAIVGVRGGRGCGCSARRRHRRAVGARGVAEPARGEARADRAALRSGGRAARDADAPGVHRAATRHAAREAAGARANARDPERGGAARRRRDGTGGIRAPTREPVAARLRRGAHASRCGGEGGLRLARAALRRGTRLRGALQAGPRRGRANARQDAARGEACRAF